MSDDVTLNGIFTFDSEKGPYASSKSEILDDLKLISKEAFGSDFVIEQGTEWYSFIDALAASLANSAGAAMLMYNSLSVNNASGIMLDTICSLTGIVRKSAIPASVVVTCSVSQGATEGISIPVGTILQDPSGKLWSNTAAGQIPIGGTFVNIRFYAQGEDNINAHVDANTTFHLKNTLSVSDALTFINKSESIVGTPEESDAQLRYRYTQSQHKQSTATVDAVKAKILSIDKISYCQIKENNTSAEGADRDKLSPHSIWVVVDTKNHEGSSWDGVGYSTDPMDIEIAETILNYRSLGCGVSVTQDGDASYSTIEGNSKGKGNISCMFKASDFGGPDDVSYVISFTRAKPKTCKVFYRLVKEKETDSNGNPILYKDDTVEKNVNSAVQAYINSLGPAQTVSYSSVSSVINRILANLSESVDIDKLVIGDSDTQSSSDTKRLNTKIFEYAHSDASDIVMIKT